MNLNPDPNYTRIIQIPILLFFFAYSSISLCEGRQPAHIVTLLPGSVSLGFHLPGSTVTLFWLQVLVASKTAPLKPPFIGPGPSKYTDIS